MAKKKNDDDFAGYVNSEYFLLDYSIRRHDENEYSWLIYHPRKGKQRMWLNGHLMNVASVEEMSGTTIVFICDILLDTKRYSKAKLGRFFETPVDEDKDIRADADLIRDRLSSLPIIKRVELKRS